MKFIVYIIILAILVPGFFTSSRATAETLSSSNYQLVNPEVDTGGGVSNSATYRSEDVIDANPADGLTNSATYRINSGFVPTAYPHIPGQPTFNNPSSSSSFLHFVIAQGGNSSDTNYAIAISSDNFTTTSYVQADNTVGVSPVFQSYLLWGGASGQNVTGLSSNTTYKIKVKARYGADSETAFSVTAQASTTAGGVTLTFTISGVASGVPVAGINTDDTTTATTVPFSGIISDNNRTAAQLLHVEGGSVSGYTVTAQVDGDLRTGTGNTVPAFGSALADNESSRGFGYSLQNLAGSDTAFVYSANGFRFASKGFQTSPVTIMSSGAATATSESYVIYRLRVGPTQSSGSYSNQITYTATTN